MADSIQGLQYRLTVDSSAFTGGLNASTEKLQKFTNDTQASASKLSGAFTAVGEASKKTYEQLTAKGPQAAIQELISGVTSLGTALASAIPGGAFFVGAIA